MSVGAYSPLQAVAAALTTQRSAVALYSRSFANAKAQTVRSVRGTSDIFGAESSVRMQLVQKFTEVMRSYGYAHGETPLLEQTALFARGLGENSDVVSKEMFSFIPWQIQRNNIEPKAVSSDESLTLRPEGTAGILRASIQSGALARHAPTLAAQNTLSPPSLPLRVYYHGPMFRYERPQRGRYRQFTQIGIERLGGSPTHAATTAADVEALASACHTLAAILPLSPSSQGSSSPLRLKLLVNSLGSDSDRSAYASALRAYFASTPGLAASLSPDSQQRLARGAVLRILDSKAPEDQAAIAAAPVITDYLSSSSRDSLSQACEQLRAHVLPHIRAGITLHHEPRLVRGLDYYSGLIFEFVAESDSSGSGGGGQGQVGTVLAGGRYDGLPSMLGHTASPAAPCVGWAAGLERLALFTHIQPETGPDYSSPGIALCPVLDKVSAAGPAPGPGAGAMADGGAAYITAAVTRLAMALRATGQLQAHKARVVQMEPGVPLKRSLPVAGSPPWSPVPPSSSSSSVMTSGDTLPLLPGANAQVAIIVGSGEIAEGKVVLRDLRKQSQTAVPVPGLQTYAPTCVGLGGSVSAHTLDVQALAQAVVQALRA